MRIQDAIDARKYYYERYFKPAAAKDRDYRGMLKYYNPTTGYNTKALANCHLGKTKKEMGLNYEKSFNPIFKK